MKDVWRQGPKIEVIQPQAKEFPEPLEAEKKDSPLKILKGAWSWWCLDVRLLPFGTVGKKKPFYCFLLF